LQAAVSLLAGVVSISGAVYSAMRFVTPEAGDIRAVVQSEKGGRPLPGSTIEVLTPADVLVSTLTVGGDGSVTGHLREGAYRLHASAMHFEPQVREVRIEPGTTAEVRFRLALHQDEAQAPARDRERGTLLAHPVRRGVGAAERFLRRFGL